MRYGTHVEYNIYESVAVEELQLHESAGFAHSSTSIFLELVGRALSLRQHNLNASSSSPSLLIFLLVIVCPQLRFVQHVRIYRLAYLLDIQIRHQVSHCPNTHTKSVYHHTRLTPCDLRYVGTLHEINSADSTVSLEHVKSWGSEGRKGNPDEEIPPSDQVYEYIVFRGSDVKVEHRTLPMRWV